MLAEVVSRFPWYIFGNFWHIAQQLVLSVYSYLPNQSFKLLEKAQACCSVWRAVFSVHLPLNQWTNCLYTKLVQLDPVHKHKREQHKDTKNGWTSPAGLSLEFCLSSCSDLLNGSSLSFHHKRLRLYRLALTWFVTGSSTHSSVATYGRDSDNEGGFLPLQMNIFFSCCTLYCPQRCYQP